MGTRSAAGVKISMVPDQLKLPAVAGRTEKAASVLGWSIAALKVTQSPAQRTTLAVASAGAEDTTVGAAAEATNDSIPRRSAPAVRITASIVPVSGKMCMIEVTMMNRRSRWMVAILLAVLGCDSKPAPPAAPPAAAIPEGPDSPHAVLRAYWAAVAANDARTVEKLVAKQTTEGAIQRWRSILADLRKKSGAEQKAQADEIGSTPEALLKMTPEQATSAEMAYFVANPKAQAHARESSIEKAELRGDLAVVFAVDKSGKRELYLYRKEAGVWCAQPLTQEFYAEEDRLNKR